MTVDRMFGRGGSELSRPSRAGTLLKPLWVAGAVALGCTASPPDGPQRRDQTAHGEARKAQVEEDTTRCTSDEECRLSCLEAHSCCPEPRYCDEARHRDDHARIEATRTGCDDFDFTTCRRQDSRVPDEVAIPQCRRGRCVTKTIVRDPPPPPVDLTRFDRTCEADSDCIVVQPQPCAKCGCADSPLAAREADRFRDAMAAVVCPPYDPWPDEDCGSCVDRISFCDSGQCSIR